MHYQTVPKIELPRHETLMNDNHKDVHPVDAMARQTLEGIANRLVFAILRSRDRAVFSERKDGAIRTAKPHV